ncbi:LrgB family protein [Xanthomonas euvesicatoria pv. alangii]|uniref:LrgB family protein n=1 Tax=Xanthomonas euvesicatoria TaxID=456327 RepID=UPI001C496628|nr:LrgB family protein [Xanthomonas euvesicatoria]MBV6670067.1 LrgB family protein [Xanthomonas euvesicatoria pv. alangii]
MTIDKVPLILWWSALTIGLYLLAIKIYRRLPRWWLMPIVVVPVPLVAVLLAMGQGYSEYIGGTHWLMLMLGPATVAFAVPIYQQRALIVRYWPVLLIGMLVGTLASTVSSWALAKMVGLDPSIALSLIPRSITTPFAMAASASIGGIPELTAVFVAVTGIGGVVIGDILLARFHFASAVASGAVYGLGAHAAGTARANQIGPTEGAIAGLMMVLVGVMNVVAAGAFTVLH